MCVFVCVKHEKNMKKCIVPMLSKPLNEAIEVNKNWQKALVIAFSLKEPQEKFLRNLINELCH